MDSIQMPFFPDMDATMLEPEIVSKSWPYSIWVYISIATTLADQEWACRKATPQPLEAGESVTQTFWMFDVKLHTFIEASDLVSL